MRIFDILPLQFEQDGDNVIWSYLRGLNEVDYEVFVRDIESSLILFFDSHTHMINAEKNIGHINDITFFGESDYNKCLVSYNWWSETAIPVLKERLTSPESADCWKSKSEILEEMFKDDKVQ